MYALYVVVKEKTACCNRRLLRKGVIPSKTKAIIHP